MRKDYEVIVLGLGGLGSAALYWLARRGGGDVLGIEQLSLNHPYGASQDHSRIIRLAYDDPAYAALTPHTYIAWRTVEDEAGLQLVFQTGGLILSSGEVHSGGRLASSSVEAYAAAMQQAGIPHESWSAAETMRHFPQFRLQEDDRVVYEASAGLVDPGKANAAHRALGRRRGAVVLENCPVSAVRPQPDGVEVETEQGVFWGKRLVVASGAWTNRVLAGAGIRLPLTVTEEQVTYFATPHLKQFSSERFPIWIWHGEDGFYGFPVYGEVATKAGQDVGGDVVTVETRRLQPNPRPLAKLTAFLEQRIPDFLGPVLYTKPCLYTMPPDRGFVIDRLPQHPHISLAIGAGHAFKFASLIGRILAELALDGRTNYAIEAMRLDRPALTDPAYVSQIKLAG